MREIAAIPRNGLKVVSTFSGCGGSCLGFEMAGYEVLWANEFIPAARETYAANHPKVVLDGRDVRLVKPEEILKAARMKAGEVDVMEGSPPCASFSTAGKRSAGWGDVRSYSDSKQRVDDLFGEYVRLVRGVQPKIFVAENVSGLVKGVAKGYFLEILSAMKRAGYAVESRLLDAQWLGVPQARQRIIFVGVRADLAARGIKPPFPKPMGHRYSILDACPWIGRIENPAHGFTAKNSISRRRPAPTIPAGSGSTYSGHGVVDAEAWVGENLRKKWGTLKRGQGHEKSFNLVRMDETRPAPTMAAMWGAGSSLNAPVLNTQPRKFSIAELKRVCSFPDDFALTGTYAKQWERLGRSVPPLMMRAVALEIARAAFGKR